MLDALRRYAGWLHLRWPAGRVEPLPEVDEDGGTRLPGVRITGDLRGVPLLKFALDSGARAVARIAGDLAGRGAGEPGTLDLLILGGGVSGMAAAVEARRRGLSFEVIEGASPFATIAAFPRRKPIYTYPRDWTPAGELQVSASVKEELLAELRSQIEERGIRVAPGRVRRIERRGDRLAVHLEEGPARVARSVLVALGRTGNARRLGVPGEERDQVAHRLFDPADSAGRRVLVVGGGDSAVEAAVALAGAGARVRLVHRGGELTRPKPENLAALERRSREGSVEVRLGARVVEIGAGDAVLEGPDGARTTVDADEVLVLIGREPPLDVFRSSGLPIAGEMTAGRRAGLAAFLLFAVWLYDWKSGGRFDALFRARGWFPYNLEAGLAELPQRWSAAAADPHTLLGTLAISAAAPAFWYTLAYSAVVVAFGIRRMRRRRTPYVAVQTWTLMAIQVLPLFLLPELVLPWLGHHGLLPAWADHLFPPADYGHGREYWRAYGLILAWPLNVYNVFTPEPLPVWLAIAFVQTCVLIPAAILLFGKGAYCGWVCSCGALAETLGDTHRHKMPHGPGWNRLNLAGQALLGLAAVLLVVRIAGWALPEGNLAERVFGPWLMAPWKWGVDVFLAGVVGYGVYFWYSGRVWCRFFCPLAALMHVYARFSRFRIFADKPRCISCGQCTRFCHQGIDVMSFAQRGAPMADPQCVRCGACVHVCPTAVLSFGRVDGSGQVITIDRLMASPVAMREGVRPGSGRE